MQGRFTKKAQDVLTRAQEAALKLGNKYVGTEHILLGLTLAQESVAAKALEGQNVTYHQVMEQIAAAHRAEKTFFLPADFTPRAKRVVESSVREAVRMNTGYVGTEHILVALIRESDNLAVKILVGLGVNLQRLYEDIMLMLGESEAQPAGTMGMNLQGEQEDKSNTETLDKFSRNLTDMADRKSVV